MRLWLAYLRYAVRWHCWPSRLQRLYMQGDPTGEVRRTADEILRQLREEEN